MDKNAEYAFDHSQYSNGRVIVAFIKEHLFAKDVANRRISVKFARLIFNSVCLWKSEIRDVVKMGSTYLIKILPILTVLKSNLHLLLVLHPLNKTQLRNNLFLYLK
jgi:hypothetical protein